MREKLLDTPRPASGAGGLLGFLSAAKRSLLQGAARTGPEPAEGRSSELPALKALAILLPVAFLAAWLYLVSGPLHDVPHSPVGFLVLLAVSALAVVFFSFGVFGVIERLQQALLQRNQEMEALLTLAREVTGSLDVDAVLRGAARALVESTAVEAAELWLVEEGRQQIVMRQHWGGHGTPFLGQALFPLGEGLPGLVAASGQPVIVHDLRSDPRFLRQPIAQQGFQTFGAFPLRARERVVGVLAAAARSPGAMRAPEERRLLDAMCDRIAVALENAQLHEQVQNVAVLTERERIARELHDGMAQVLTYINAKAHAVDRLLAHGELDSARHQLRQMADTARSLYAEVREAILSLRSQVTRDSDLLSVLQQYVAELQSTSGLVIHFQAQVTPDQLARLSFGKEIQVLRVVQEALSNVRKHARASEAWVVLRGSPEELEVVVRDDGRGFDPHRLGRGRWPRFGLQSMDERARAIGGTLHIESEPGRGTSVILRAPWSGGPGGREP